MKWLTVLVTTVLLVGISDSEVKAQSVTITKVVTSKGSITAGGQATVPGNWKIMSVELFASLPKGVAGEGGYLLVQLNKDGSFGGKAMKVPPAKYSIFALLTATDDKGIERHFFSDSQVVDATGGS